MVADYICNHLRWYIISGLAGLKRIYNFNVFLIQFACIKDEGLLDNMNKAFDKIEKAINVLNNKT